jgi:hypothetical protein
MKLLHLQVSLNTGMRVYFKGLHRPYALFNLAASEICAGTASLDLKHITST